MENERLKKEKKSLTVRDLIITGVFSALIFIGIMLGGFVAIIPTLTFYLPITAALLPGPIFLLMLAKVPKHGPAIISGSLMAIFVFATGMHWAMAVGYLLMGVVADRVAGAKNFKNQNTNIIAYIIFCFGATGSYLAFFINPSSWISGMLEQGTSVEYLDAMQASGTGWVFVIMILGTVLVAGLSGLAGSKMLKKQFEKAGITA